MAIEISLVLGPCGQIASRLGMALDSGALRQVLVPRAPQSETDLWTTLTLVAGGRIIGEARLEPDAHPRGLWGAVARLALSAVPDAPAGWLASLLSTLRDHAIRNHGLATLIAEPVESRADITAALTAAAYAREGSSSLHCCELISPFWRGRDVLVIAEAGSNWRMGTRKRDISMAKTLIDVAAASGADVVKFQSFRPDALYAANAGSSDYLSQSGIDESMDSLFADIQMPHDMLPILAEHARSAGIGFMSTAFSAEDFAAVDALVEIHKIASYEITHLRLIELAARSGKPTVMSTGGATLEEVAWAVSHYQRCGGRDLCLMQCTAKYPSPLDALNLAAIPELSRAFGVSVGLSDHSRDPVVAPLAATAMGARVIEKHFTLDNRLPGPDHAFAVEAGELKRLVTAVRAATATRGTGLKAVHPAETELALFAQRGLQAIAPIRPGDVFVENGNIAILRPGKQTKGIHPRHIEEIAGRIATRQLSPGEGLQFGDWAEPE